jgi:hypothetical protein
MGCLDDITCGKRVIIGIRDHNDCAIPESGLYLQDFVPGLTLRKAAQVASAEYESGRDLLQRKCALGARLVFNDFKQYVSNFFDFNAVVETQDVRRFTDNVLPASTTPQGLVLKRWRSEIGRIFIETVYIRAVNGGLATIQIKDGSSIKQYQAHIEADTVNEVMINHWCDAESVRLTFSGINTQVYTRDLPGTLTGFGGCTGCGQSRSVGRGLYVTGWDGTKERPQMYGVGVRASVRCSEELLLCPLIPRMYYLMGQRSGMEFLKEIPNSNRPTPVVIFDAGRAEALLENLQKEYYSEYNRFTKTILRHIQTMKADCLTCNTDRYVQQTP